MIGEYLKKADKFIKEENFDAAEREVQKALEEEPTNIYALAYKDRIPSARRLAVEKKRKEEEQRQRQEQQQATPEVKPQPSPSPTFIPPPVHSPGPVYTPAPSPTPPSPPPQYTPPPAAQPVFRRPANSKEMEKYKKILHDVWHDGIVTTDETIVLKKVRGELNIGDDVHYLLEKEVKLNCYVESIRTAWKDGLITPTQPGALESFRRKFGISIEEHISVEGKIMFELQENRNTASIFLIDDEAVFLEVMKESLSLAGYTVFSASTPEEAVLELKSIIPDIIICDIHFENSDLDGLFIYDQVRRISALTAIPFLFLSGVQDEEIVKNGLSMGVDDFISKPFNIDTLLAVVEGKLKRYRQLKRTKH